MKQRLNIKTWDGLTLTENAKSDKEGKIYSCLCRKTVLFVEWLKRSLEIIGQVTFFFFYFILNSFLSGEIQQLVNSE